MIEVADDADNVSKLNAPHIFASKLAKTDDGILESLAETEENYWKDLCEPQKVYSRVKNAEEDTLDIDFFESCLMSGWLRGGGTTDFVGGGGVSKIFKFPLDNYIPICYTRK